MNRAIQGGLFLVFVVAMGAGASPTEEGRVAPNAEAARPLAVGSALPSAMLERVTGEPVDLRSLPGESGALLVFYRGGW